MKNNIIDTLKIRIAENANRYFHIDNYEALEVKHIPDAFLSTNPVYLFEVIADNRFKKEVIAKITPPEESEHGGKGEFEILKKLYGNHSLVEKNYAVPYAYDYFDDLRAILIEKIEGEKLSSLLRRMNMYFASQSDMLLLESSMKNCGACLRTLHSITRTGSNNTIQDELFIKIKESYEFLTAKDVINPDDFGEMPEIIYEAINKTKVIEFPMIEQHGDYHIGNLILGKGLSVIDFTFSRRNVIYHDISCFLKSLDILNPYPANFLFNFRNIPIFKRRFLEGYFQELTKVKNVEWLLISIFKVRNTLLHFETRCIYYSILKRKMFFKVIAGIYKKRLREYLAEIKKYSSLMLL